MFKTLKVYFKTHYQASGWFNGNHGNKFEINYTWDTFTKNPADYADFDNQICVGHKDKNGIYDAEHGISPGDDGEYKTLKRKLFIIFQGAPLICVVDNKPVIMGAAVYTHSSFQLPNFPNLFTKVSSQVEWIQQFMEN